MSFWKSLDSFVFNENQALHKAEVFQKLIQLNAVHRYVWCNLGWLPKLSNLNKQLATNLPNWMERKQKTTVYGSEVTAGFDCCVSEKCVGRITEINMGNVTSIYNALRRMGFWKSLQPKS